jgi:hypothetical protein
MTEKKNKFMPKINTPPINEGNVNDIPEDDKVLEGADAPDDDNEAVDETSNESETGADENTEQEDNDVPIESETSAPESKEETPAPIVETPAPVVMIDTAPKSAPDRNVKIRVGRNHSCSIGGTSYHFEAGKVYNVPLNVKKILEKVDLLKPL